MAVVVGMIGGSFGAALASSVVPYALGASVTIGWSTAFFAASVLYQQSMARRARKAMDARKGQFISFEGTVSTLPIVYGRARVGGVKVYQTTSNDYKHRSEVGPVVDTFMAGTADGTTYEVEVDPGTAGAFEKIPGSGIWYKTMNATAGTTLDRDRTFANNEMLYVEQAICVGPIEKCWDVVIDDNYFYNRQEYNPGLRIVVHREGGQNSQMIAANSKAEDNRANAVFTDVAHAAMAFRYNPGDPQYSGTPNVNFLIEGRKVFTVTGSYTLSTNRTYTVNPAYCLLDYLMDEAYGLGLKVEEIDLKSFYTAAQICERNAGSSVPVSGKIWKPTNGARNVTSHTYKQFECNVVLDTAADIRENVNTLLATMHGARLVWSAGRYSLSFVYPTESAIESTNVADIYDSSKLFVSLVTDDQLIRNTVEIIPPSLDEKLNYCTVRFFNEAKDFKEDTASWPPRFGTVRTEYLTTDNGKALETDITAEGITSFTLAQALAEETVRASRIAAKVTFSCIIRDRYYEPGDVIKLQSAALNLGYDSPFYVRIDEVTLDETGVASIKGTRFDKRALAFNASDNVGDPSVPSSSLVQPPTNFTYVADTTNGKLDTISGKLTWTASPSNVAGYELYFGTAGEDGAVAANQKWGILGRDNASPYEIQSLSNGRYVFGIKAYTADNRMSTMVTTSNSVLVKEAGLPAPVGVTASTSMPPLANGTPTQGDLWRAVRISWTQPAFNTDQSKRYSHVEVWHNLTGVTPTVSASGTVSGAILVGTTAANAITHNDLNSNAPHYYWARNVTKTGTKGVFSSPVTSANPKLPISAYLTGLSDYLDELNLAQLLRQKINWTTDVNYADARNWVNGRVQIALDAAAAADAYVDGTRGEVWSILNQMVDGVTDTVVKDSTSITTLKGLKKRVSDAEGGILELNTVNASSTSTLVKALRALAARVGANTGEVIDLTTINTDTTGTLITKLTTLDGLVANPSTGLAAAHGRITSLDTNSVKKDGVEMTRLTNIEGTVNNATTGLAAAHGRITSLDSVSVKKDGVEIGRITTLEGKVNNATTGLEATHGLASDVHSVVLTPTTGLVSKVGLLETSVNTTLPGELALKMTAGQVDTKIANATPNAAMTQAIATAKSEAIDAAGQATTAAIGVVENTKIGYCTIGGVASDQTTKSTCESAGGVWHVGLPLATAVKQVTVNYTSPTTGLDYVGGVEQIMAASVLAYDSAGNALTTAQDVTNRLNATYALRVSSGNKVSGFGLANDGVTSDFVVVADKFFVADNDSGSGQVPFVVLSSPETIGGISYPAGVYAKNAYIHNLQISRGQIQGGTIAATYGFAGTTSCTASLNLPEAAEYIVVPLNFRYSTYGGKGEVEAVPVALNYSGTFVGKSSSISATISSQAEWGATGYLALMVMVMYR